MEIIKAGHEHKEAVLKLLDDFRTECSKKINPEKESVSTSAKDSGGPLYDKVVDSPECGMFLAKEGSEIVGLVNVYKIPQIRRGLHSAEIEEIYVIPEFRGKGVAKQLIDAVIDWSKKNGIKCVRLESGNELKRAHSFYEKVGFRFYAKGYERLIE
jgi:GNAT superfamily N-acetyltransferase